MSTLYDLTHHRSGIILRDGKCYICDDWRAGGIPIQYSDGVYCIGEPVPSPDRRYYEDRLDLMDELKNIDYGQRMQPYRGMVYFFGEIIVISPDEWK